MMSTCPVCGKLTCIHWPEHWVYKRGQTYYCSAMCMDVDIVRDVNILKQVREDRRKRKEAKKMYNKLKKDGTPAKKSGPKPKKVEVPEPVSGGEWEKVETPETNKVEIVETPERQIGGLCPPPEVEDDRLFHTAAVRSKKLGTFYYDDKHGTIDWRHPYGEEISLFPEDYRLLRDSIDMILHVLGV